jgi:hypothetical protein
LAQPSFPTPDPGQKKFNSRIVVPISDVCGTIEQVSKGNFPAPRTIKKDVPSALQAVCLKAMALRPENRYSSARALADDIEQWLADEPIAAKPDSFYERVARWTRQNRTWTRAMAGALGGIPKRANPGSSPATGRFGCRLAREDSNSLNTLGVAQYRGSRFGDAVKTYL